MKAVLISIQPKWCELIARGKKTVEVRKTKPKIETPFKVYIYCTKDRKLKIWTGKRYSYADDRSHNAFDKCGNGKVIGEFVCNTIFNLDEASLFAGMTEINQSIIEEFSCVNIDDLLQYKGDKSEIYAWDISNLIIYDKPKELSKFYRECEKNECEDCTYLHFENTPNSYEGWCTVDEKMPLKRPPQSWCYVKEV